MTCFSEKRRVSERTAISKCRRVDQPTKKTKKDVLACHHDYDAEIIVTKLFFLDVAVEPVLSMSRWSHSKVIYGIWQKHARWRNEIVAVQSGISKRNCRHTGRPLGEAPHSARPHFLIELHFFSRTHYGVRSPRSHLQIWHAVKTPASSSLPRRSCMTPVPMKSLFKLSTARWPVCR